MSDFGFKIALPGYDVKTATPEQCSLHSTYPHMKIQRPTGGVNFWNTANYVFSSSPALGTTTDLLTVTHGYGYNPASMAFVYAVTGAGSQFPIDSYMCLPASLGTGTVVQSFRCYADNNVFKIQFVVAPSGTPYDMTNTSWTFKYYIFVENGA